MSSNVVATYANDGTITTLELLEEINMFRAMERKSITDNNKNIGGRDGRLLNDKSHKRILQDIRDEFDEEIREEKLVPSQYDHIMPTGGIKKLTMFNLTMSQAKQVLVRESKIVRKAVIKRLEALEQTVPVIDSETQRYIAIGKAVEDVDNAIKHLQSLGGQISQGKRKLKQAKSILDEAKKPNSLNKIIKW